MHIIVGRWVGDLEVYLRAGKTVGSVDRADIWNLVYLEVEHAHADEGRDKSAHYLSSKSLPRRNLDIMSELQILRK